MFEIAPITVQGSTQVDVTAINNAGAFVGDVLIANTYIGFIQAGTSFTRLAGVCGTANLCEGYPTDINASGAVTGLVYGARSGGFVWKNGGFVLSDFFPVNGQATTIIGPFINDRGGVAFNTGAAPYEAYAGKPSSPVLLGGFGLVAQNAYVTSINNAGLVAGFGMAPGLGNQIVHFIGKNGVFSDLPFNNQNATYSTLINNKNDIAFTVGPAAFVYSNGTYTQIALPAQAENVTVQAFTDSGRLAGTYFDSAAQVQTVFLYNGTTVSTFGSYPGADQLYVSMNNRKTLIVDDIPNHTRPGTSFLVHCKGPAC